MGSFLELGQLYRIKGFADLSGRRPGHVALLFHAEKTTRCAHLGRTVPDYDGHVEYDSYDWGWDISLLLGEEIVHFFYRYEDSLLAKLEKIGSK